MRLGILLRLFRGGYPVGNLRAFCGAIIIVRSAERSITLSASTFQCPFSNLGFRIRYGIPVTLPVAMPCNDLFPDLAEIRREPNAESYSAKPIPPYVPLQIQGESR